MSAGDKSESMTATVSDLLNTGGPVQQVWFVTGLILGHQRLLVVTQLKGVITPLGFHSCARMRAPGQVWAHISPGGGHSREGSQFISPTLCASLPKALG